MTKQEKQVLNSIYPPVQMPDVSPRWVLVKFNLVENNWKFSDFQEYMKTTDKFYQLIEIIKERHSKIKNLQLFDNVECNSEIKASFQTTIQQQFNLEGSSEKNDSCVQHIFYKFDIGVHSPILLFSKPYQER